MQHENGLRSAGENALPTTDLGGLYSPGSLPTPGVITLP